MATTTASVLATLVDQIDTWRTVAAANRRMARPGHEAQQWDKLAEDLTALRRRARELLAHAQAAYPSDLEEIPATMTDEIPLEEIDRLHTQAVETHRHLPELFRYATFRADAAPDEHGYDRWEKVRHLTASLIGAMNHTFGFPEAADSPSEPELQERTPAGAFREFLPELPRLITIAHHAAHNARTPDAAHCWVKTHQRLLTLQAEIHDALRVEQLDDARTAHEENP